MTSMVTAASSRIQRGAHSPRGCDADEPHYPRPARRVGGTFPGARRACRAGSV